MCYRSCDVRILGTQMVRSVWFVCNKIGKCLCETLYYRLNCEGGTNGDVHAFQTAYCTQREMIKN
jgi:hypothetical protein